MSETPVKCTAVKGGYSAIQCDTLKEVSRMGGIGRRKNMKGLFYVTKKRNLDKPTQVDLGKCFTLHDGDHVERGVVLNVCPFCAGPLHDYFGD